jgi:hypothetical protein
MYGGDDGARTRDLCRDSTETSSNLLKLRVTDGFFWCSEIPMVTVIGPLSDPRPLPCKPLPFSRRSAGSNAGQSPHRLGRVPHFLALALDRGEQVLPRFVEGLGALRFEISCQFFEINSRRSKTV